MSYYIVGTNRNPLNEKAITGFYLWNAYTKTNKATLVSQTELKQLLKDNKIEVSNIILNEKTGKLESLTTNLQGLSYTFGDKRAIQHKNCVIDYNLDGTTKLCKFNFQEINVYDTYDLELDKLRSLGELLEIELSSASNKDNTQSISLRQAYIRNIRVSEQQAKEQKDNNTSIRLDEDILEQQAKDVNVYWNIKQFDRYMKNHNWKYKLTKVYENIAVGEEYNPYYKDIYSVDSIDENCEVVHLPVECVKVNHLFESKPKCKPTIIFSPLMMEVNGLYLVDEDKYNELYLADEEKHNEFGGITNAVLLEIINGASVTLKSSKTGDSYTKWGKPDLFNEIKATYTGNIIVENIYFQKALKNREGICVLKGLSLLDIVGTAQLPCYSSIIHGYNGCNIRRLEIREINNIIKSFNKTKIEMNTLDLDVCTIQSSFMTFGMIGESTVNFCEKMEKIQNSFKDTDVRHFEFSQARKLKTIESSFWNCVNLRTFDVSMLENIYDIRNILQNCKALENFKLPQVLHTIGNDCLEGTPGIKEISIPESIQLIIGSPFSNGCDVIYPEKVNHINRRYFRKFTNAIAYNPIFKTNIDFIEDAMESVSGHIRDLKLPKTIDKTCFGMFSYSHLTVFDSQYLPLVDFIKDFAFEYSSIEEAIFRNNVVKLGPKLFNCCKCLKKVVIDSSVQQMDDVFAGMLTESPVTVYVVKGSFASKKLRRSSKLVIIQVDSIEEAFDTENETSETKQAKFELLLNGTEYKSLLGDGFKQYAGFNYKLLESVKNNTPYMETKNMKLDTSKYVYKSLNIIPGLKEFVYQMRERADKELKSDTREFISISNLITSVSDNYLDKFTDGTSQKFIQEKVSANFNSAVKDSIVIIEEDAMVFRLKMEEWHNKHDYNMVTVLIMIYKNQIVWMTPFESSSTIFIGRSVACSEMSLFKKDIANWHSDSDYAYLTRKINKEEQLGRINIALGNILIPGDILSGAFSNNRYGMIVRINGKDLHYQFADRIENNIKVTCKVIGIKDFEKKYNKQSDTKSDKTVFEMMLFDILNQKFIICACKLDFSGSGAYIDYLSMKHIIDVVDIDTALTKYKSHISDFIGAFRDVKSSNKLNSILATDDIKQAIMDDISNYDTKGNMNISYVAELIYTNNIKTVDDILKNKKLLQRVIDSKLYTEANISLNQIKNKDTMYKNTMIKTVGDGNIVLEYNAKFTDGGDAYFIALASPTSTMNSKKLVKMGLLSLNETIQMLYIIGQRRASGENKATARLGDNTIDIDNFYVVLSRNMPGFYYNGCRALLAIDKYNSDTYLIGEQWDSDFVKVFRFRDPHDGLKVLQVFWQSNKGDTVRLLKDLIVTIIDGRYGAGYDDNILSTLRREIQNGLPNNYMYTGDIPKSVVDLLAKQPKQQNSVK